jgi:subtilisin
MPLDLSKLSQGDGKNIRVAVIDSGIQSDHDWVGGRLITSYQTIETKEDQIEVVETKPQDPVGHGTACAGQIRRYAPNVDIISVRILSPTLKATSSALLAALRWLPEISVNVVNLSLSTMRKQLALEIGLAIDDLYEKNVTCICARGYHKTGKAYPTNFANTIAVTYSELIESDLKFRPKDLVEFDGPGVQTRVAWKESSTRVVDGSSYACPLVTGLACRMLSIDPTLTPYEIKSAIKQYAIKRRSGWHQPWMDQVEKEPTTSNASSSA